MIKTLNKLAIDESLLNLKEYIYKKKKKKAPLKPF